MPEARSYDLSRYQRIVGVESGRVRGNFHVLRTKAGVAHVKTLDVVVWDEAHRAGRCLYSNDLTAFVRGGDIELPKHMITESVRFDVEDAWDDMITAIRLAAEAFPAPVYEGTTP